MVYQISFFFWNKYNLPLLTWQKLGARWCLSKVRYIGSLYVSHFLLVYLELRHKLTISLCKRATKFRAWAKANSSEMGCKRITAAY